MEMFSGVFVDYDYAKDKIDPILSIDKSLVSGDSQKKISTYVW